MKKNILLTGATGFLGSFLLEGILNRGYAAIILTRESSNAWRINHLLGNVKVYDVNSMDEAFQENSISAVLHAAISYGNNGQKIEDVFRSNILYSLKLLESAKTCGAIFINTDTILHEKYISGYTLSKKQFVEWLKYFSGSIPIINLRIGNIYGHKDSDLKFVAWIINELLSDKETLKLTEGEQKRDFIHVSDVVDACLLFLKHGQKIKGFNEFDVGTGSVITIKDLVLKIKNIVEDVIQKRLKTNIKFGAYPYRENEVMELKQDLHKINQMGWKTKILLEEGLKSTVEYYYNKRKEGK